MGDQDKLLDSDYDGIKEFDNDLPRWWVYLFYLTIVFAPIYYVYFHIYPGVTPEQRLAAQMKEIQEQRAQAQAADAGAQLSEDALLQLATDEALKSKGKEVFLTRCAPCHGQWGEGLVGPNLTDAYWIHGGKITDIRKVIETGVLDKGMISWKGILSTEELNAVLAFAWSLKGTNPQNPKPPQGELVN